MTARLAIRLTLLFLAVALIAGVVDRCTTPSLSTTNGGLDGRHD